MNLNPLRPSGLSQGITSPSGDFTKEIVKVLCLCLAFVLLYILLFIGVLAIAIAVSGLGIWLAVEVKIFITIMLAIGAIGMGVMLVFFMLKSLAIKKADPIATVGEVTRSSEPQLYEFILKICKEAKAPSPKRIFLTNDVNAFVSYSSTFLSLFFPARKNLYIGLGLVNATTVSELKAVIAHEFGHFSQGSMRFGSYVHHFNQIIFRIVEDNPSYNESVERWANFSGYFAFFARINIYLIQGVQEIMGNFYRLLNKGYMGLSRQMEFHADAVAASVAGSAPLISGLYRIDLAMTSYDMLIGYYNEQVKENLKADNLYAHHFKLIQLLAERQNVPLENGFPMISTEQNSALGGCRIVVKDQWASHPSVADREQAVRNLNSMAKASHEPAWLLFSDPMGLQAEQTSKIYKEIEFPGDPRLLDVEEFAAKYTQLLAIRSFNQEYKGYYDNRYVAPFDLLLTGNAESLLPPDLFDDRYLGLPRVVGSLEADIFTLDMIAMKGSGHRSFDFDGIRHDIREAAEVKEQLNAELERNRIALAEHDQLIYGAARANALLSGSEKELEDAFMRMLQQTALVEKDIEIYNDLMQEANKVYSRLPFDQIKLLVSTIIQKEKKVKSRLRDLLTHDRVREMSVFKNSAEIIELFLDSDHVYFAVDSYLNDQLNILIGASNAYVDISQEYCFLLKKDALHKQAVHLDVVKQSCSATV
ncbi:MAG: M48 family metalloprotease [Arcticibacter sp.]